MSRPAFGPQRVTRQLILAADVVAAFKVLVGVGVDVRTTRIWQDRSRILDNLGDGEDKVWLQEMR